MRLLLLLLLVLLVAACAAAPLGSVPNRAWTWVWLLTGPRDAELEGEARSVAFTGHFANIDRMRAEGELLVVGPLGDPRAHDDHRGVFVLATDDLDQARAMAGTDPAAQAGVFVFDVEPFRSADALDRLPAMHAAAVAASGVEDPPPGIHCRTYVLVTAAPADAAERALAASGAPVLFAGRLGAGADERALACLRAATTDEARALLPEGEVAWTLMPWFATEEIANLRSR